MFGGDPTASPERALIAAVIAQAVRDLFVTVIVGAPSEEAARREALAFLTDETGAWAQSREALCLEVGIDPGMVRRTVISWLDGEATPMLPHGRVMKVPEGVDTARALWARLKAESDTRARTYRNAVDARHARRLRAASDAIKARRRDAETAATVEANRHHVDAVLNRQVRGPKTALAACVEKVIAELATGPKTARELFFALDGDHAPDTISRALDILDAERDGKLFRLPATAA